MKYAYKCKNIYRTKIENVSKFQYFVQYEFSNKNINCYNNYKIDLQVSTDGFHTLIQTETKVWLIKYSVSLRRYQTSCPA